MKVDPVVFEQDELGMRGGQEDLATRMTQHLEKPAVSAPIEISFEDDQQLVALAQGVGKGDPDAAVTIVEFGDYQCPGCGSFAVSVKPRLEQEYVSSGEARFVYYDFPLIQIHPNAFLAARAARCADDQDLYWEYHEHLFRNQTAWSPSTNPGSDFRGYADELGLDIELRNIHREPGHYEDLARATGRGTVPCLRIESAHGSTWMHESVDIIEYLRTQFQPRAGAV